MPFPAPILYRKSIPVPYELFSELTCPLLSPFSLNKPLLPEYELFPANYMPFTDPILCLKRLSYPIRVLLCQLYALYWPHSPSLKLCYPIWALLYKSIPLLGEFSITEPLLPEYGLIPANYMPFTDPIPCQKGFVTPCEFFYANYMPFTDQILH